MQWYPALVLTLLLYFDQHFMTKYGLYEKKSSSKNLQKSTDEYLGQELLVKS